MPRRLASGLLAAALLFASSDGGEVEYIGGTLMQFRGRQDGRLSTADQRLLVFLFKDQRFGVAYERINLIEYGQKVNRRLAEAILVSPLFLISKSRKHFLTIGYRDENDSQQALVFRVDKNDVRMLLVSLEARTGLRVQYQDEEARKAGKG